MSRSAKPKAHRVAAMSAMPSSALASNSWSANFQQPNAENAIKPSQAVIRMQTR